MSEKIIENYLADAISSFRSYQKIAEKALAQVTDEEFFKTIDEESNSIAVIVKHLAGNQKSRWTDFLTSDGEKENRNRDSEFVAENETREDLMEFWEAGWNCLYQALEALTVADFEKKVLIRGQAHTICEAINRQLTHYSYHIGQITFLAKHFRVGDWQTLSVPKNKSDQFNSFMKKAGAEVEAGIRNQRELAQDFFENKAK